MKTETYVRPWPQYNAGPLRFNTLDGKKIAYHTTTEFLVQVGKGKKGSYQTKYVIRGNLAQAVWYYNCINLGPKYKKRLLMPSCSTNGILARQSFSGLA